MTTQNHEAATPNDIPSTVELLGNIFRALTDHSLALESRARELAGLADMRFRAMQGADDYIGRLQAELQELKAAQPQAAQTDAQPTEAPMPGALQPGPDDAAAEAYRQKPEGMDEHMPDMSRSEVAGSPDPHPSAG